MILKRRITDLERRWPKQRTLAELCREAQSISRLTATSWDAVFQSLVVKLSDAELETALAEARAAAGVNPHAARGEE
jgi:hypothetical protein